MIKAIIFDCWDTLFYAKIKPNPFDAFAERIGKDLDDYKFMKSFERHFMLKKYFKSEKPIKNLLDDLNIKYSTKLIKELNNILKKAITFQTPFPETFEVLKELKKDYKIGLITNIYYQSSKHLKEKFKVDKFFNVFLESYKLGIIKPNPKIFNMMIKKLKVKKNEVLMVGDTLKDDVQGAEKCGIKGILIDRKGKHPKYQNRITSLKQLKKFL